MHPLFDESFRNRLWSWMSARLHIHKESVWGRSRSRVYKCLLKTKDLADTILGGKEEMFPQPTLMVNDLS